MPIASSYIQYNVSLVQHQIERLLFGTTLTSFEVLLTFDDVVGAAGASSSKEATMTGDGGGCGSVLLLLLGSSVAGDNSKGDGMSCCRLACPW